MYINDVVVRPSKLSIHVRRSFIAITVPHMPLIKFQFSWRGPTLNSIHTLFSVADFLIL